MDQKVEKIDEKVSNKKIFSGFVLQYVYLVFQILAGILFIPLISKHYGQDQYGLITLSNSFVYLFMTDIGISMIANRFLSQYRAQGKHDELRALMGLLYKVYFALSALIFLILFILYFFVDNIFQGLTPQEMVTFKEIYISMGLCAIVAFSMQSFDGVLTAYEEYAPIRILNICQKALYIIFVSLALAFDWPIISIALIAGLTSVVCYAGRYFLIRFKLHLTASMRTPIPQEFIKSITIYALWQVLISLASRMNSYLASPILGIVSDSKNIAAYGVSMEIEAYAFYFANVLSGVFLPKISRIFIQAHSEERKARLMSLAVKTCLIMSSLSLLMVVGFASCGEEFINIWMRDPGYEDSYIGTIILMCGLVFYGPNMIFENAMYFDNNIKYLAVSYISSFVVFIALSFPLGMLLGSIGMCIAVACSGLVKLIVSMTMYGLRLKMNIGKYLKDVYLKQIPVVLVGLGIGLTLHFLLPLSDLYSFLIIVPSVAIPYLVLDWFIVYPKELKRSLFALLKRNKKNVAAEQ